MPVKSVLCSVAAFRGPPWKPPRGVSGASCRNIFIAVEAIGVLHRTRWGASLHHKLQWRRQQIPTWNFEWDFHVVVTVHTNWHILIWLCVYSVVFLLTLKWTTSMLLFIFLCGATTLYSKCNVMSCHVRGGDNRRVKLPLSRTREESRPKVVCDSAGELEMASSNKLSNVN